MPLIIGFGHKARHGKDEAIKIITQEFGRAIDIQKYGFGDALKREVNEAVAAAGSWGSLFHRAHLVGFPLTATSFMPLPSWVVCDPAPPMDDPLCPFGKQRTLLQFWGTEYRRAQAPDYWVKKTMAKIAEDNPEVALICDVRFPNEVEGIRAAGGYVVRVDRVGFVSDVPEHYSEKALDGLSELDWDYVIKAPDGQIEVLREEAVNAFNFLRAVKQTEACA